jgi:hypothetical protein
MGNGNVTTSSQRQIGEANQPPSQARRRPLDLGRLNGGQAQVPESLFDDLRRTDDRPALFDEPTFRFLNRRAGIIWQRVRDLLDEWFGRVPDEEARADLRGRLRSGTEVDFRSAFFELYCHEALRRAGWGLEHHPLLVHTSRRPDLRASRGGVA